MLGRLPDGFTLTAPANYGSAFTSRWDEAGRERAIGMTLAEFEQTLKERGKLYE